MFLSELMEAPECHFHRQPASIYTIKCNDMKQQVKHQYYFSITEILYYMNTYIYVVHVRNDLRLIA